MRTFFHLVCTGIILCNLSLFAQATEKDKAVALVKKVAAYISENGVAKGKEELNKSDGLFVNGNLYVFAFDTTGVMVAHPKNSKLIGMNLIDVPDVDGKLFRKEIIDIAKKKGSGWVDYKYKKPANSVIESKTTFIQLVNDLVLCCGITKK